MEMGTSMGDDVGYQDVSLVCTVVPLRVCICFSTVARRSLISYVPIQEFRQGESVPLDLSLSVRVILCAYVHLLIALYRGIWL